MRDYDVPLRHRIKRWWLNVSTWRRHKVSVWRKNRWNERRYFMQAFAEARFDYEAVCLRPAKLLRWDSKNVLWYRRARTG